MTLKCPDCGHEVGESDDLEAASTGGHADVTWYRCPECDNVDTYQSWALEAEEHRRTKRVKQFVRTAAIESIERRELLGQSPVPDESVLFDLRGDARRSNTIDDVDVHRALVMGGASYIRSVKMSEVPQNAEALRELLAEAQSVERRDGGWVMKDDSESNDGGVP